MQKMVAKHQAWRLSYENNRYLKNQKDEVLFSRLRYLIENITTLTPDGKIGFDAFDPIAESLWIAFTHTHHEMLIRGLSPPDNFLKGANIAQHTYPNPAPGSSIYEHKDRLPEKGKIFKFGKYIHLKALVEHGVLRLSPASTFDDDGLPAALRDNEIKKAIYPPTEDMTITFQDGKKIAGKDIHGFTMEIDYGSDYYVWCTSCRYSHRMFADFSADSCLVISDHKLFIKRLHQAIQKDCPDYRVISSLVDYIDPYNPKSDKFNVALTKHHRYAYQREYRTIAHPHSSVQKLKPLFMELNLNDLELTIIKA